MLVPGHVVALFLATGGQNGPALGCDEKEVVLLVYVIIDVATESVSSVLFWLQLLHSRRHRCLRRASSPPHWIDRGGRVVIKLCLSQ